MKRLISIIATLLCSAAVFAQSAGEIVNRMEKVLQQQESDGVFMIVDVNLPVLGTLSTKTWMYGDKMRAEAGAMGVELITWTDGITQWVYNSKANEIEISNFENKEADASDGDIDMFVGLDEGYDLSIKEETGKAWHILCKKSKANKDKDAPKTINIMVEKGTFNPMSLTTKMKGVTLTMRDLSFNVTEKQATFNQKDYPDAKIIDKRQQ